MSTELFPELEVPTRRMPAIKLRSAHLSKDRKYRWTLTRAWDASRPMLLVAMFNPSDANEQREDPTVSLVCQIADANGYGGIVVVNLVPIVSSTPQPAFDMLAWSERGPEWGDRDLLQQNLSVIELEAGRAGAVLLGCGALAGRDDSWFEHAVDTIECAVEPGTPIYCLGKTAAGYPLHPLARGKLKVKPDAKLIPWRAT